MKRPLWSTPPKKPAGRIMTREEFAAQTRVERITRAERKAGHLRMRSLWADLSRIASLLGTDTVTASVLETELQRPVAGGRWTDLYARDLTGLFYRHGVSIDGDRYRCADIVAAALAHLGEPDPVGFGENLDARRLTESDMVWHQLVRAARQ